jgi:hypothetical protein
MPTPTLTTIDLADPAPPVPGARERAAVHARAQQLRRRRRLAGGAGALALVVVTALGVAALAGGGSGTRQLATLRIEPSLAASQATIQVDLKSRDFSVTGQVDSSGTVRFSEEVVPGTYNVFVTVDSASADRPEGGADIGSARVTYRSEPITLEAGVNTLDLDTLTPRA